MEPLRFLSMASSEDVSSSPHRLVEFQRNCSFVAFILVVAVLCLLTLFDKLRAVLLPLVWAAFFALPLECAVKFLSRIEVNAASGCLRAFRGRQSPSLPVLFWYVPGRNRIRVESTEASLAMLSKVNNPFNSCPCSRRVPGATPAMPGRCMMTFASCCRRRVRIHRLHSQPVRGPNQLKQGALYHVTNIEPSPDGHMLGLALSVDGHASYPAIFDEEDVVVVESTGTLEVDKTSSISWMFAIFFVILLVLAGVGIFATLIYVGAQSLLNNFNDYVTGVNEFLIWAGKNLKHFLPPDQLKSIQEAINKWVTTQLPVLAEELAAGISSFLVQAVFMVIYLLFWLSEPIPVAPSVAEVFKTYLLLKSCVCLLFATLMSATLYWLHVKIWPLFFVITFLLNYIPEIGSMLCGVLSVFVVLFDGSTPTPDERFFNALILMVLFGIIKILTANIIEMRMYSNNGGEFMRMHPVVLLAMMFVGRALLGLSGMFLSVPVTAALKFYLVSADMPVTVLDPMLVFIEGDEMAPHRNYVDKRRAEQQRKLAEQQHSTAFLSSRALPEALRDSFRIEQETQPLTLPQAEAGSPLLMAEAS